MRKLAIVILVFLGVLTAGTSPALAAPITVIGLFSWEPADPFTEGLGPTFSFFNNSGGPISGLFVDGGVAQYDFLYYDGTSTIPNLESTQITALVDPAILFAFIRSSDPSFILTLLDPFGGALVNGLDGEGQTAEVGLSAAPVPEPGTLLLLGSGLAGMLANRRRLRARR